VCAFGFGVIFAKGRFNVPVCVCEMRDIEGVCIRAVRNERSRKLKWKRSEFEISEFCVRKRGCKSAKLVM
jgi:hypothetical protein